MQPIQLTFCILMPFLGLKRYSHPSDFWKIFVFKCVIKWLVITLVIGRSTGMPANLSLQNNSKSVDFISSFPDSAFTSVSLAIYHKEQLTSLFLFFKLANNAKEVRLTIFLELFLQEGHLLYLLIFWHVLWEKEGGADTQISNYTHTCTHT